MTGFIGIVGVGVAVLAFATGQFEFGLTMLFVGVIGLLLVARRS